LPSPFTFLSRIDRTSQLFGAPELLNKLLLEAAVQLAQHSHPLLNAKLQTSHCRILCKAQLPQVNPVR
jgi:hypothetical protein